jgi:diguanylate cyclase (GGDEF)-like protein/PAS domain S-box-containing protein
MRAGTREELSRSRASLLTFATGPAAALVLVGLSRMDLIADTPYWLLTALLAATGIVNFAVMWTSRAAASRLRLHLRLAASASTTALVVYATGWGSILVIGFAVGIVDVMRTEGSAAWRTGLAWSVAAIVAGEAAVELDLAPSIVSAARGHAVAIASTACLAVVLHTLGASARDTERARAGLEAERALLRDLVAHAADVIVLTSADGDLEHVSPAVTPILGLTVGECQGRCIGDLMDPADQIAFDDMCHGLAPLEAVAREFRFVHRDGTGRRIVTTVTRRRDRTLVVNLHDVTRQRELEDQLRRQAIEDSLTKLPNRHALVERLEFIRQTEEVTVFFIDLDGFKEVNDALGHEQGDTVLKEAARRLADAVPGDTAVGRIGGDEFLAFNADPDEHRARAIAARMLDALAAPWPELGEHRIGASIGIARGDGEESLDALIHRADAAMYEAKSGARGGATVDASVWLRPVADPAGGPGR